MNTSVNYHKNKPPHIVLLVLDTHRLDRLSCYGFPEPISPHIDAFASTATRFTQAISPAQWTVPAHGSFFTGLYPHQHGLLQIAGQLQTTAPTLIERLKTAGYNTAGFSNNPLVGVMNNGLEKGFTHFINYASSEYQRKQKQQQTGNLISQQLAEIFTQVEKSLSQSLTVRKIAANPGVARVMKAVFLPDETSTGDTRQSLWDASQWLIQKSQLATVEPQFIFINLMGTHHPYAPSAWAVQHYVPTWSLDVIQDNLRHFNKNMQDDMRNVLHKPLTEAEDHLLNGLYNAEVATQDAYLGQFFDRLAQANILDDCFIIMLGDHGENLGEHNLVGHSYGVYRDLVHVPCFIRDPRGLLPAGQTEDTLISTRRVFHTLLTVAGQADDTETQHSLDRPERILADNDLVLNEAWPMDTKLRRLLKEHPDLALQELYRHPHFSIYQNGYKLIATPTQIIGLYQPEIDPAEAHNLHPEHPDVAAELYQHLRTHWSQNPATAPTETDSAESALDPGMIQRMRDLGYLD